MRIRHFVLMFVLVAFGVGSFGGCKSAEDKVCGHMKGLLEAAEMGERYSDEECAEEIAEIKEECTNPGDVFSCFLEKDSLEAIGACEDICEEGGEEAE